MKIYFFYWNNEHIPDLTKTFDDSSYHIGIFWILRKHLIICIYQIVSLLILNTVNIR